MSTPLQVFKFGGASVRDADGIRNVGRIIREYGTPPLVVVVSAVGKTTNALEDVVAAFAKTDNALAAERFAAVKQDHFALGQELLGPDEETLSRLNDAFVEVDWLLEEPFDQSPAAA